jgi:Protein of unknown function (DUF2971)
MLEHRDFKQPEDTSVKVWRYLSLTKFLDLYFTESLFLSRVDLLDDKHEGTYTKINSTNGLRFPEVKIPSGLILTREQYTLRMRQSLFVNCWRMDNYESEAMWKLYCPSNEGVAIQTTYEKLANSLPENPKVFMGKVEYLNYETESFDTINHFNFILHKRKSFEHEKEIRIATSLPNYMNDHNIPAIEKGIRIQTNLLINIEAIYINPFAAEWFLDIVQKLFTALDIKIQLQWSEIKSNIYL